MDIVVASFNKHKIGELVPLFPGHRLLCPSDLGIREFEIEEDGQSYLENAAIKARAIFRLAGIPTLADDSGLSVDALSGAPGIHSARYGALANGEKLPAAERNELLLSVMRGKTERACAFHCALVLIPEEGRILAVEETCPGILLESPRGMGGFGFDPIVFLPGRGKSVAELTPEEKAGVSHRGKAGRAMARIIEALFGTREG